MNNNETGQSANPMSAFVGKKFDCYFRGNQRESEWAIGHLGKTPECYMGFRRLIPNQNEAGENVNVYYHNHRTSIKQWTQAAEDEIKVQLARKKNIKFLRDLDFKNLSDKTLSKLVEVANKEGES